MYESFVCVITHHWSLTALGDCHLRCWDETSPGAGVTSLAAEMASEAVNKQLGPCLILLTKTGTVLWSARHEELGLPHSGSWASHGPELPEHRDPPCVS